MKRILVLNGPNLNLLGTREPEIYGSETLADIEVLCRKTGQELGVEIDFRQSNHEGELVEMIQKAKGHYAAIAINAAAYSHTSVAIHDALKFTGLPIAEVHISDPKKREEFRHFSYIETLASVYVAGEGAGGYAKALRELRAYL